MSIEKYPEKLTTGYYRVRRSWEDKDSQIGAYRILANAIAKVEENPGHSVFTDEGEAIYPEAETVEEACTNVADESAEVVSEVVEETYDKADALSPDKFPTAAEYENDDNEDTIAYARLTALMNIRDGNSLDAEIVTTNKKNTILEILQFCSNGWLRVRFPKSETGFAYVSNEDGKFAAIGYGLHTVQRGDNLWKIAETQLGDGTRYPEIKELNSLTSNTAVVGMRLILPKQ